MKAAPFTRRCTGCGNRAVVRGICCARCWGLLPARLRIDLYAAYEPRRNRAPWDPRPKNTRAWRLAFGKILEYFNHLDLFPDGPALPPRRPARPRTHPRPPIPLPTAGPALRAR